MPHDVFISYSSTDKNAADAVCAVLERNGIRCWIAPRDVTPGMVWGSAIVGAIHGAKIMVLVFSGAANASPQIEREVERAISKGIPVIPFRIEDVQPSDSLEYFISASHWLDAFTKPLEQHLETLAKVVQRIIEVKLGKEGEGTPATRSAAGLQALAANSLSSAAPAQSRSSRRPIVVAATAALVACLVLAALFFIWEQRKTTLAGSRQVGEVFRDCATCPEMVVVPAGSFTMGSPESEPERSPAENPQLKVTIAHPFAVGKFAVTRGEFEAFVKATGHPLGDICYIWSGTEWKSGQGKSFRDPGFSQDDKHPVVCVNWYDAAAYAAWLSKTAAKDYRLLSEAQREYVTRAGTTTPFWWGSSITPAQANYNGNFVYEGGGSKGEYRGRTVPVDSFEPNPWGFYNVHANVSDWTEDCWNDSNSGNPGDGTARTQTGACDRRVVRGGSWYNSPNYLRSANRSGNPTDGRGSFIGFRVGRTLTP